MNEKFTPGEWILGVQFRGENSMSEWCNLYADGESNSIAEILLYDGIGKNYYNATLIAKAPKMYELLNGLCKIHGTRYCNYPCDECPIQQTLKEVRGEE